MRAAWFIAAALALGGCSRWKEGVDPSKVREPPSQSKLTGAQPIRFEQAGHAIQLTPRARYRITGYVAETSRKLLDEWKFLMPLDVGLIWGAFAEPRYLEHMSFHLSKRYFSFKYAPGPGGQPLPLQHEKFFTNSHLIASSDNVRARFDEVKIGDLITLHGQLVDVEIRDAETDAVQLSSRTSLSRSDTGNGACEQVWVEKIEIERPR